MQDTVELLDWAMAYAVMGLPVLALRPFAAPCRGDCTPDLCVCPKTPATRHGKDDATTDLDQIEAWWTANPSYNIGVRPPLGYFVLDVDPRNNGYAELRKTLDGRRIPKTWVADTGSGGWHIWLKDPDIAEGYRGKLCPGVDIKHDTGYLVMPPSVHPNGQPYRWSNQLDIAVAPQWLLKMVRPKAARTTRPWQCGTKIQANSPDALVQALIDAEPGNKDGHGVDDMLLWCACRAIEEGSYDKIRGDLKSVAIQHGHSAARAERTLQSAESRAAR